jgi:hypothetical protein
LNDYADHRDNTKYSVAWTEEMRSSCILVGKREGKRSLEDVGVNGKVMLKLIFNKSGLQILTGFIWLRIGSNEHDIETSGSKKVW